MLFDFNVYRDWYQNYIAETIQLLLSFNLGVEEQIDQSIHKYQERKPLLYEQDFSQRIEVYRGVDDMSFDLNTIFLEYFPNLQRKWAFVSIYSLFEHELIMLCEKLRTKQKLAIAHTDLRDKGISKAVLYIEKVAGVDCCRNSKTWQKILLLNKCRNVIVHNNGMVRTSQDLKEIQDSPLVEERLLTIKAKELILNSGLLGNTIFLFKDFCLGIDRSLRSMSVPQT